jgi:cysteine desulfurase
LLRSSAAPVQQAKVKVTSHASDASPSPIGPKYGLVVPRVLPHSSMTYLDHHAATPIAPSAQREMAEAQSLAWANPSSVHAAGRASRTLLERARERVARAIHAASADIVLTGGGTEACNLGVIGAATGAPAELVSTRIEHPAVTEAVRAIELTGWRAAWLAVPRGAAPDPDAFAQLLGETTRFAALQWVNHETGTVLPIAAYAARCRARGVRVFVDATQALGKLPVDVEALGADYVALASHKIGGPAGAGALWVRRDAQLGSLALGGSQERGRRAGTPDVVSQVGFGAACDALEQRLADQPRIARLRDRLETALLDLGARRNADAGERVATVANLWFPGQRADVLVAALDVEGLAASSGAACSSGKSEPSPILLAMHADQSERASSSIRFSFGPETTETDADFAVAAVRRVLDRQRG